MQILKIDTSTRIKDSFSRQMAQAFVENWKSNHPNDRIISRDLAKNPIPHVTQSTIEGMYSPPDKQTSETIQATKIARELIAEIKSCDVLVLSTPMYNFGVPSNLKAYIDQISWPGALFEVQDGGNLVGLLKGKKAYVFTASGAPFTGGPFQPMDFTTTYLKGVMGFFGFETEIFAIEGATTSPEVLEKTKASVLARIKVAAQ